MPERYCLAMALTIGICAPSTPFTRDDADRVIALAREHRPQITLHFHDQCFETSGHFAGPDDMRRDVLAQLANDRAIDAVWFARGGYGAARIAGRAVAMMGPNARHKVFMGYSDGGNVLAALYKAGIGHPVHGPMCADIRREGGEAAIRRALDWFAGDCAPQHCPSLEPDQPTVAFNLMTLAMMTGTELMPDLSGHILLLEEVSEYLYGFDRAFLHLASNLAAAGLAGIRLGQVSDIPDNDRPFGMEAEDIARFWCDRYGIRYLGRADIGHVASNRIVPFGLASRWPAP